MSVTRIWEAPRVTLPYTDAQWAAIEALGHKVDADLVAGDVRLTQGGEPTFVSIDDREGGEWNTDAVGPTKRILSADLMDRLRAHYGAGGLLHYGQGKWYPGEQLPRWSLNLFWRKDGEPIWTHPELIAERAPGVRRDRSRVAPSARGRRAPAGGRSGQRVRAYEDTYYYLWRERKLPSNVDPLDARLADPFERERLRQVFSQGLRKVVGHGLPIARSPGEERRWRSTSWFLRDEHCYLVPGDSALGYRLPLDSQPWAAPNDLPWIHPPDPNQDFPDLASHKQQEQQQMARLQAAPSRRRRPRAATRDAGVEMAARPARAVGRPVPREPAAVERADRTALRVLPPICAPTSRPRSSRGPRSAPSRATAASTSSCRRPSRSRTTSSSSPRSRTPRSRCGCR